MLHVQLASISIFRFHVFQTETVVIVRPLKSFESTDVRE